MLKLIGIITVIWLLLYFNVIQLAAAWLAVVMMWVAGVTL